MISAVLGSSLALVGDLSNGIYTFILTDHNQQVATVQFELITENPPQQLDISEDAFDADYELSLLLDITPLTEVWFIRDAKAQDERLLAETLLTAMQMVLQERIIQDKQGSPCIAFVKPLDRLDNIWGLLEPGYNSIVYTTKNLVALC